jgi:hypothetical protein
VEVRKDTTQTFACFPFGADNDSALALFTPVLIINTPALGTASVAALFSIAAFAGAPAFGVTLALDAAPAFGTDFIWEGAAFDKAAFVKDAPVLFGARIMLPASLGPHDVLSSQLNPRMETVICLICKSSNRELQQRQKYLRYQCLPSAISPKPKLATSGKSPQAIYSSTASRPPIEQVALMKVTSPASWLAHSNDSSVMKSSLAIYEWSAYIPLPHTGLGLRSSGTLQ